MGTSGAGGGRCCLARYFVFPADSPAGPGRAAALRREPIPRPHQRPAFQAGSANRECLTHSRISRYKTISGTIPFAQQLFSDRQIEHLQCFGSPEAWLCLLDVYRGQSVRSNSQDAPSPSPCSLLSHAARRRIEPTRTVWGRPTQERTSRRGCRWRPRNNSKEAWRS